MKINSENQSRIAVQIFLVAVSFAALVLSLFMYVQGKSCDLADVGLELPESVVIEVVSTDSFTGASEVRFTVPRRNVYEWLSSSRVYYELSGRDKMAAIELEALLDQSLLDRRKALLIEGGVSATDLRLVHVQVWVEVDGTTGFFHVTAYLNPQ